MNTTSAHVLTQPIKKNVPLEHSAQNYLVGHRICFKAF